MDKILQLKIYVDGVNDTPFPQGAEEPLEIGAFRYDAKRMGGAPTITASVNYPSCLDNEWTDKVYAEFRDEKYYLKQTPTSSYNNESTMYKHDLELISERVILDNVYFYDAVKNSEENSDAVSNSTTFPFFGDIVALKDKLNASLRYADLQSEDEDGVVRGWEVVVDDNITSDEKLIPFDNAFFSNAIQESYNTFKIPYYFKGKKIHFGYTDNTIAEEFSYGVDDALLSITKTNANYKVVNRVTGVGSSENIPYYYPNNSPKGDVKAVASSSRITPKILDYETFTNKVKLDGVIKRSNINYENLTVTHNSNQIYSGSSFSASMGAGGISKKFIVTFDTQDVGELSVSFASSVLKYLLSGEEKTDANFSIKYSLSLYSSQKKKTVYSSGTIDSIEELLVPIASAETGYKLTIQVNYAAMDKYAGKGGNITYNASFNFGSASGWTYDGESVELKDLGLAVEGDVQSGDTITQTLERYINTSNVLLPPKYRETDGEQRFYNATNDTYTDDNGEPIVFTNPFVEGHPKEHIITVDDIKPTIKGAVNAAGLRIDMFSEFAYDQDDNDETYVDEEDGNTYFKHPYFYGKLRIMDFNLFDHAIENQPMTISFTSGDAGACNFEIGVTEEYPQMNPVQVYEEDKFIEGVGYFKAGSLKRDVKNGRVICGIEGIEGQSVTTFQERQQDTSKYEVWIALKKEEETYGVLMPQTSLRPKACTSATANDGDTFVILGINLPQSYIDAAEEKLEKEIIKYMYENNVEKFKFSIRFSRIYFEENPDVLELLDENSRIYIWYNGTRYTLYVSSISYSMADGEVLPDIVVELDDTLAITQNALQNAISQVKADIGNALGNIDITALATPYFIRKDQDDEANGVVNFKKGIKFGEGGKVTMYDDNSAKLTIEYLEVTKKATFTSLEIQEKTHVGGQMLISPAAMNCGEVENILDEDGNVTAYRCYMQTKGQDGEEIFNQFAVGDQAICQTYNAWGSKYYWRLVTAVGEDYIDLSVTDCDEESDIPEAGDKIIQLGHRTDKTRQAAQVLSAHGETAPAFIMYNGINDYTLEGKEVTGILWNPATQEPQMYSYGNFIFGNREKDENGELKKDFITFQPNPENPEEKKLFINADVQFGGGSKGLSDLSEWQDLQGEVGSLGVSVQKVQDQVDGVVENWNGEGTPTLTNEPAATWIKKGDAEKIAHINDTYINIQEYVDDATTPTAGHAWRWCQCGESEGEGSQQVVITGPLTQGEWVKVGQLDVSYNYNYVVSPNGKIEFAYDQEITIISGPPTYIKVDRSGAIYLLDNYSYFVGSNSITLLFEYADYTIAYDKDDNLIKLHWHPIADSDAVRALKDAAEATEIAVQASLTNILSVGETFEGHFTSYAYYGETLPITVNAGEKYTFHIENISMLSETDSNGTYYCYLDDLNNNWLSDTASGQINKSGFGTLTIKEGVSNSQARFLISKNETSASPATVRITRMSLVKGTRPMMTWKQNTDYLTNAFKNGTTKISGGLTMAQAVMVEDESGTVRGMLNGSDYAEDATHGRLIVAAGSEGALASQLAAATTRIYEDGTIDTNKIKAKGGEIGVLKLLSSGRLSVDTTTVKGKMTLGEDGLFVGNNLTLPAQYTTIGGCGGTCITATNNGSGVYCPMDTDTQKIAIMVASSDTAILCTSGMFAGLRPYLQPNSVSSGYILKDKDHTVFIGGGTLYLPNNPQVGQEYKIIHTSTSSLDVYVGEQDGSSLLKGLGGTSVPANIYLTSTHAEMIEIVYGGANWWYVKHSGV